uniref:Uncharacterized protein n=1 Tax=viral metagenome TaxID=1070528 RepID=A0A6M3XH94_9ZZZZ
MKKVFLSIFSVVFMLIFVSPAYSMADKWENTHNESGLSEAAVEVIKKIALTDEYDWVVARFNPLTSIGGSGCTIVNGTTSFPTGSEDYWYRAGGVTMNPSQFKLNKVLSYWFTEETDCGTKGTSGSSTFFKYQWVSSIGAGATHSGQTDWKVKVFYPANDANHWTEILTTSGQSIFASSAINRQGTIGFTYFGSATLGGGVTTDPVSDSSTTFYPTFAVGWGSGVTPVINVIGKR